MGRDITLGQYVIAKSPLHRLDPRIKLLSLVAIIAFIFVATNFVSMGCIAAIVVLAMCFSGVKISQYIRSLRAILVIVLFTSIFNLFYGDGQVLVDWGWLQITAGGIRTAIFVIVRIVVLIFASSVLTFTTSPNQLADAMERLLKPLTYIKVPVHEIAMMMTIAIRFIPTLSEETEKIMKAQTARGADFESGNVFRRAKAMIPLLVPLFISAFRRADDLAVAMDSRCYHGGKNRTRMKQMRMTYRDALAGGFMILFAAVVFGVQMYV